MPWYIYGSHLSLSLPFFGFREQDCAARLIQQAPLPAGPKCEDFGYLDLNIESALPVCLSISLSLCVCINFCGPGDLFLGLEHARQVFYH